MPASVPSANVTMVLPVVTLWVADRTCFAPERRSLATVQPPGAIRTIYLFSRHVVRLPSHQTFRAWRKFAARLIEHLVEVSLPDGMSGRRYADHAHSL